MVPLPAQCQLSGKRVYQKQPLAGNVFPLWQKSRPPLSQLRLPDGPRNIMFVMGKSLRLEGFNTANYFDLMSEFQREMSGWIHEGKITWKETIEHGIENAPTAFLKLLKGENFGKMLVKLS